MTPLPARTLRRGRGEIEPQDGFAGALGLGYPAAMGSFFSSLFAEMGARRRRLRVSLGDRGQGLAEFLVLGGLLIGSLGLYVRPWMPAAAPWGLWVPLVFIVGYLLIESRRQRHAGAVAQNVHEDDRTGADRVAVGYDWIVFIWSLACALLGAAAFVIAWSAAPPAPAADWTPPESTVPVDISP